MLSNCWSYSISLFGFLTMDCPIIEIVTKVIMKVKMIFFIIADRFDDYAAKIIKTNLLAHHSEMN